MTTQTTAERIKQLQAEMEALKATIPQAKVGELTVKIGEKGTINVYGLGRFPVCLYATQAVKLNELMNSQGFKDFVASNADKLSFKA